MTYPQKKIFLSPPHLGTKEIELLQNTIDSNWISPFGEMIDQFEEAIAHYSASNHALATNSGTSAIHLALKVLKIQTGDYVICATNTFIASGSPILYEKAIPVLVDSEADTWNMSPKLLEEAIISLKQQNVQPKAIIVVHLYGMPAKMQEILEIANHHDIPVVEDAAESLGSQINQQQTGSFGELGIYSFNGNKIITTSAGGMLISNTEKYIDYARYLANQAKKRVDIFKFGELGYNYLMSNVLAAIGLGQMEVLNIRIEKRRANFELYKQQLSEIEGINFQTELDGFFSNRWLSTILFDKNIFATDFKDQVYQALAEKEIQSRPGMVPLHLQNAFMNVPSFLNNTSTDIAQHSLCLPSGSQLTESDIIWITDIIKAKVKEIQRIRSH